MRVTINSVVFPAHEGPIYEGYY